ncbi:MAG: hypothetical protein IPO48_01500 [Saprospiraceae bacterium]|nr:hypothetical protein [Saprospiraceae bacterium]
MGSIFILFQLLILMKNQRDFMQFVLLTNIYDHTENSFAPVNLTIISSGCNDPVIIIPEISVSETNGAYIVNGSMFNGGNVNHCLGVIDDFQIKATSTGNYENQLSFDYNHYKGTQLLVALRYKVNGNIVNHGHLKINFKAEPALPPFEIVCYDDPVVKTSCLKFRFLFYVQTIFMHCKRLPVFKVLTWSVPKRKP